MISPLPMAIRYVDRIGSDVNTVKSMKNGIDYSKWFAWGLEIIFHDFFNISTKLLNIFQRFNLQHKIFRYSFRFDCTDSTKKWFHFYVRYG